MNKRGRETVFSTALDLMNDEPQEEYQDLSKPRKVPPQDQVENKPRCDLFC